jgi:anti-sigma factor RsiW
MTSIRQLLECRRTARNLQRFLDRDPSAPLSEEDRRRVAAHLDECEKCAAISAEYQALHASLQHLGSALAPDPQAVERVRAAVDRALASDDG